MWGREKNNAIELTICNAEYNKRVCKTRVVHSEDGKTRTEMWAYMCERCLLQDEAPYNVDEAKELFDYFYMSGAILCPQCRNELERFKNNAYKLRIVLTLDQANAAIVEDVEEFYPTMDAVNDAIDKIERETPPRMLSMGMTLKEKKYMVSYIPYAERKG